MKIVAISDTHEREHFVKLPDGDVLVHSGDFTFKGEFFAIAKFCSWMKKQNHTHKLVISGNHELTLDTELSKNHSQKQMILNLFAESGITYIENSSVEIEGIKFYGSPFTPRFYDWGFNVDRGPKIGEKWKNIPDDVNVLITHGPGYGTLDNTIRDGSQGCEMLAQRIPQLKQLKAHIFGHLHHDGGKMIEKNGVKYVNGAICTDQYIPSNPPVVIEI